MRIRAIHTDNFGVLGTQSFEFKDDWGGDIASRILLSGPNGCGKSTLLTGIGMLWATFGFWLQNRKTFNSSALKPGGLALVLEDLPFNAPSLVVYSFLDRNTQAAFVEEIANARLQKWLRSLEDEYPNHVFLGQLSYDFLNANGETLSLPENSKWLDKWTHMRQRMLVSPEPSLSPNILYLDAEKRHWVKPKLGIGEFHSEDLSQRWLSSYQATSDWNGQVESALLNMKVSSEDRFSSLIDNMNSFLSGKKILKRIKIGENRLHVLLDKGDIHSIDLLSAGERQVLIMLYMVDRWLEKGGIALIDEPDLFLHPSLISGFLAQLEKMIAERDGQLIITSHIPEVWERYENLGKRVTLGADE